MALLITFQITIIVVICATKLDASNETCSSTQFECDNGNCVDGQFECNRVNDCADASDELYCFDDDFEEMDSNEFSEPELVFTNLQSSNVTVNQGENLQLVCKVSGHPEPQITWSLKNREISFWSRLLNYSLSQNNSILSLQNMSSNVQGLFECKASNPVGKVSAFSNVFVKDHLKPSLKTNETLNEMKNQASVLKPTVVCTLVFCVTNFNLLLQAHMYWPL